MLYLYLGGRFTRATQITVGVLAGFILSLWIAVLLVVIRDCRRDRRARGAEAILMEYVIYNLKHFYMLWDNWHYTYLNWKFCGMVSTYPWPLIWSFLQPFSKLFHTNMAAIYHICNMHVLITYWGRNALFGNFCPILTNNSQLEIDRLFIVFVILGNTKIQRGLKGRLKDEDSVR